MKKKGFAIGHGIGLVVTAGLLATINALALGPFRSTITTYLSGSGLKRASDIGVEGSPYDNASKVVDEIQDESMVLLRNRNNALPLGAANPSEDIKVNVMGYNTVYPFYGGTGSGDSDHENPETYLTAYSSNHIIVNDELIKLMKDNSSKVDTNFGNTMMGSFIGAIPELPTDLYEGKMSSAKAFSDIAIVNIGRLAGEGSDLPTGGASETANAEGQKNYLILSEREKGLLRLAKQNFGKVIVCLNAANPIELGYLEELDVDAILWIGHPGAYAMNEVGKALRGTVNPSGRTVDTWAYDNLSSPASRAAGAYYTQKYPNLSSGYYVDYHEGIYVGYRYYETKFLDKETEYKKAVQFPFGYGLSYTSFKWSLKSNNVSSAPVDGKINIEVEVENTGNVAGKDVVEVYYTAPYTNGGIEKSAVDLVEYGKTKLLAPGEKDVVSLSFDVKNMASYDFADKNSNTHKGYELEAGDYSITVRKDSHTVSEIAPLTYKVSKTTFFDKAITGATIVNQLEDSEGKDENVTYLTRADNFTANFPSLEKGAARNASDETVRRATADLVFTADPNDPEVITGKITKEFDKEKRDEKGNIVYDEEGNIVYETDIDDDGNETIAKRGLLLSDMAGLDYDDPLWEDLLNQLTTSEMNDLISHGGYKTDKADSIGKGVNRDLDGPQGFNFSNVSLEKLKAMSYNAEINVASTWNKDLAYREGIAFGAEANDMGVTGVYCPAVNIHRSPYGGRNYEYYSEDPLISGSMAANFVQGANTKGLNCFVKHFALNDQETQRASGLYTYCNEQALRQIYLKPFQLAVEEGKTRCIMTSFNRVGRTWSGAYKELLTNVLRGEWGFQGMCLTDYYLREDYMAEQPGIVAGNDCWLAGFEQFAGSVDLSTNTAKKYARQACHNILFAVANAKATNITVQEPWLQWFVPADIAAWTLWAGWAAIVTIVLIKANKKPAEAVASKENA